MQTNKEPPHPQSIARTTQKVHIKSIVVPNTQDIRTKYDFLRVLGSGHYGTVRLVMPKSGPKQMFAVKTIVKTKLAADIEHLRREINILFSLDHPNIIKLFEVFEDAKYMHLVTEYCRGGELFDRILANRYSEHEAAALMHKVFLAVNNLHHNHICHRDLKPENFMFESGESEAELKLIDFGLSNKFFNKFSVVEMTSMVGTPDYVAPEVLHGVYGPKCDVWSAGVLMYVLLSGHLPFASDSTTQVFTKIMNAKFSLDAPLWETFSPQAVDLISKLLEIDQKKRLSVDEALAHPWFQNTSITQLPINRDVLESLRKYKATSQFQSEAYAIIVKRLDIKQIKELKETFMALDREKNGFLSFEEVKTGLVQAGFELPGSEVAKIIQNADFRKDGRINYSEFIAATLDSRSVLDEEQIWNAFLLFDVDNSGFITEANLKEALTRAGRHVSDKSVRDMMREVGVGTEGIDFESFKNMITREGPAD